MPRPPHITKSYPADCLGANFNVNILFFVIYLGYDTFSLVTSYTNPNNHTATINRDPNNGNPETIVNHLGYTTTLDYDSRGLVIRRLSPNGLDYFIPITLRA